MIERVRDQWNETRMWNVFMFEQHLRGSRGTTSLIRTQGSGVKLIHRYQKEGFLSQLLITDDMVLATESIE